MKKLLHNSKIYKFGFTLAEVLITLVIIGVVAALTIPTAINKYKDEELKSQFRKAYSTITQAIYKIEMNDFYGYARCYSSYDTQLRQDWTDCRAFFDALAKNLHVQKICRGNAKAEGCVPTYYHNHQKGGCEPLAPNGIENDDYVYVLPNGQIIITFGNGWQSRFLIDINGKKPPNALGKDLFEFAMQRDKGQLYTNSAQCLVAPYPTYGGGRTTSAMIQYAFGGKK